MRTFLEKGKVLFILGTVALLQLTLGFARADIIYVDDFGARPDGLANSHAAVSEALKKAAEIEGDVIVQFGQGRYIITPELPKLTTSQKKNPETAVQEDDLLCKQAEVFKVPDCFELSGVRNITIQGDPNGTELVITSPLADVLRMRQSSNIVVKDIVIDYDPLPFTQGTIIAIDGKQGTFDLKLDEGFPSLSEYWFSNSDAKWGVVFDERGLFRLGADSVVYSKSWEQLEGRVWRMSLRDVSKVNTLLVGDRFVHVARTNGKAALFFDRCSNVHIRNVTVYSCSSSAVQLYTCEGTLVVDGLVVRPRPGTGRLLSTNSDPVHCQANRRGPLVENCLFEGCADDAMNFYGAPSIVTNVLAPNKVEVNSTYVFCVGDRAQIIYPETGTVKADGLKVIEVAGRILTFDKEVKNLHVGQKGYLDSDTIYNLSACSAGFVVRNNIIGGFRGRGIVVRGGDGVIENNIIKDVSGQGIFISNNPMWPEGPMPYNTVVRNNVILGARRDSMYKNSFAIEVRGCRHNWLPSQSRGVRGVVIENNLIIDPPGGTILIQSAKDVVLRNNTVQIINGKPGIERYSGITIRNCEDVSIERFVMTDPQCRVSDGLIIEDSIANDIKITELIIDLAEKKDVSVQGKSK